MKTDVYLLDDVIAKARLKGARIRSWEYSPNNRIIIQNEGESPIYYLSVSAAADHLIYQYNLRSHYDSCYSKLNCIQDKAIKTEDGDKSTQKSDEWLIEQCDAMLNNRADEISSSTKYKIFQYISQAHSPNKVTSDDFFSIQDILVNHYRSMPMTKGNMDHRTRLRQMISMIERITYHDYLDLF